jgi:ribulose-phosphate 3-epimerase
LDIFDGHLVPDLGFAPRTVATLRPLTSLPFEVHLAAVDPMLFVPHLAEAGVDLVLFHVESVRLFYEAIFTVREHGCRSAWSSRWERRSPASIQ